MGVEIPLIDYYQVLLFAILAAVLTILTLIIDHKRLNYETLLYGFSILIRYYIAVQMINYGLSKLYYMQFQFPSAARLDQELGDFYPMGLLWIFMGYSKGYTMFAGALEFIAGVLLLFRKTTTLGALTTFGVMLNVMMLNYCYDVPVKLLSTHLVLMACFLIAIDGKRLLNFFILNQPVQHYLIPDIIPERYQIAKKVIKGLVIMSYMGFMFFNMNTMYKEYGSKAPKPYFAGKYVIEDFQRFSGDSLNLDISKRNHWMIFYQNFKNNASIKTTNNDIDGINYFQIEADTIKHLFKIKQQHHPSYFRLKYEHKGADRFMVYGKFQSDSLHFTMRKEDINQRLLVNRGFHWISESPFNR